ncbi:MULTISPECIES: hypothetical protein [Thalassospira]|uniref:Porin n=2 Tax=Thalassospira TaxID=168934 RepID=A0A367WEL6_9PROT|nr:MULTISPECIES: hypothetical protein [Thalassospira]MDG4718848.1 hypothetical protein [Thalassospira sp. FZY0004]RCK39817.1 hypothetical protein TH19_01875 [Thalassospira profundimaris]
MRHFLRLTPFALVPAVLASPAYGFDGLDDIEISQSIKSTGTMFKSDTADGVENNAYEASLHYSAKTDLYLTDTLSMVLSGYVHGASHTEISGAFVGPNNSKSRSPYGDLIEAGVRWDGDDSTIKIGKWKQNYEFAERLTLLNRYNLGDYTVPLNNVNTGNWLVQWQRFFDEGNLNVTVMPYHPATGQPYKYGRWGGADSNGSLDSKYTIGGKEYTYKEENLTTDKPDLTLIWEGSAELFDYAIGASRAQSLYSVSKEGEVVGERYTVYPYATSVFGGISWPLDSVRLFMEAYYQNTDDGIDDDFVRVNTGMAFNFYNTAERIGLEDLNASLEFLADRTVEKQSNPEYSTPSSYSRPFQNALYGVVSAKLTSDWTLSQELARGFSKRDLLSMTKLTYNFDDSTRLAVQYTIFDGIRDVSLFGNWKDNDNVTMTFTKDF